MECLQNAPTLVLVWKEAHVGPATRLMGEKKVCLEPVCFNHVKFIEKKSGILRERVGGGKTGQRRMDKSMNRRRKIGCLSILMLRQRQMWSVVDWGRN